MPRYKPHTRETIEKIRQSIDTASAVKTLHEIGHDDKAPISVRVKALQILLDKTLPTLSQSDINKMIEYKPQNYAELVHALKAALGQDMADKVLSKYGNTETPAEENVH